MSAVPGRLGYSEPVQVGLGVLILLLFVLLVACSCGVLRALSQSGVNERGCRVPARLKEAQSPVSI